MKDLNFFILNGNYTSLEMDYNTGIREAKEKGIEQGKKKKQIEMAKKLLSKNMTIEEIMELSIEEIQKL